MNADTTARRSLHERMNDAAQATLPLLEPLGLTTATLSICRHGRTGYEFVTLSEINGPIVAISPESSAARAQLLHELPGAKPLEPSGAADWANAQDWDVIATAEIGLLPEGACLSDHALADLDAQWAAFRDVLEDAYQNARRQVQDVPPVAAERHSFGLECVNWTNGQGVEVGIYVYHATARGTQHDH